MGLVDLEYVMNAFPHSYQKFYRIYFKDRGHGIWIFLLIVAVAASLVPLVSCDRKSPTDLSKEEIIKSEGLRELIRISGSAPAYPLFELLSREFEKLHSDARVKFLPPARSAGGSAATFIGDADLGLVARPLRPQESDYKLRYLHFAKDALVFVTPSEVKIKNLSKQQLIDIYQGKIVNWQEVGGQDAPIRVLDRSEHTAAKIALRASLFGPELVITNSAVLLERESQMHEALIKIQNSIGYTSLAQVIASDLSVNVLDIDGIPPTLANLADNKYKLSRLFGVMVKPLPDRTTMKFIDFIFSKQAASLMERNGYLPFQMQLVIGIVPERNILTQEDRYLPLIEYLSKQVSAKVKITLQHLPSYEAVTSEFLSNKINAAFFGSFSFLKTTALADIEVIARPEKDGISGYKGLLLVRKDSGIKDYRDMRGKRIAMIKNTTAGNIFPRLYFKNNGIDDFESYLGGITYVVSHDAAIMKVINKEVDIAAAKDTIFWKLKKEDGRLTEDLVILAESETVPENALVISRNIDIGCYACHRKYLNTLENHGEGSSYEVDLKSAIKQILLHLHETQEGRRVLQQFDADRFLETTDADYEPLSKMVKTLGLDLESN